ncbi:protein saal1 [Uranotaenia lowii]|uniref:protein saal1 n=1 Tax=Uranotaenia lowii TaxID=190385 RepID=UPI00247AEB59|nr:protein saal1 [Uranotaenia lowii]
MESTGSSKEVPVSSDDISNLEKEPTGSDTGVAATEPVQSTDVQAEGDEAQEEILEKLKGDRIGETMYSERFVLTTILKLPQLETPIGDDEDFEKDLCSLWDMTIEKDVVLFLLKHDVVELFVGLTEGSQDNRLIEILLGIIGNMCCVDETHRCLYDNKSLILSLCDFLDSTDTLVLVQLMRIFTTIFDKSDDEQYCWFKVIREVENMTEKMAFILSSTINQELIEHTIEAIHSMVNRFTEAEVDYAQLNEFYTMFAKPCLVEGLMEGFKQIYPEAAAENQFEQEFLNSKDLKIIQKFLDINENFIINANEVYENQVEKIVCCMYRILHPLSDPNCLIPLSKAHIRILVCINSIYSAIVYHFHPPTFLALIKIYNILAQEQKSTEKPPEQEQKPSTSTSTNETEPNDDAADCEFDIQTALGEILETTYFMAEPIDGLTIANTLRTSSFNEETIRRLCDAFRETMAGDPLLNRTCELLQESARSVWGQEGRGRT